MSPERREMDTLRALAERARDARNAYDAASRNAKAGLYEALMLAQEAYDAAVEDPAVVPTLLSDAERLAYLIDGNHSILFFGGGKCQLGDVIGMDARAVIDECRFCGSVMPRTDPPGRFVCRQPVGHTTPHRAPLNDEGGEAMWTDEPRAARSSTEGTSDV